MELQSSLFDSIGYMLNPTNNELTQLVADYRRRLDDLSKTRQPYYGSWINLSVGDATLDGSAETITFANMEVEDFFQSGSRIRLSQSSSNPSSYVYSNVVKVDTTNNSITLLGESLSGDTLLYLDYSNIASPIGFPTGFSYTPTLSSENGYFSFSDTGNLSAEYYILGNVCTVEVVRGDSNPVEWTNPTGWADRLLEELPIDVDEDNDTTFALHFAGCIDVTSGGFTFANFIDHADVARALYTTADPDSVRMGPLPFALSWLETNSTCGRTGCEWAYSIQYIYTYD
jgi:hypothetical protein